MTDYQKEKAAYENLIADTGRDAWQQLMRDGGARRRFLYFKPNGMAFACIGGGDSTPEGFELVTAEPIPCDRDMDGVIAWIRRFAGRLPIYPA